MKMEKMSMKRAKMNTKRMTNSNKGSQIRIMATSNGICKVKTKSMTRKTESLISTSKMQT